MIGFISNVIFYAAQTWTIKVTDSEKPMAFETDATEAYFKCVGMTNLVTRLLETLVERKDCAIVVLHY